MDYAFQASKGTRESLEHQLHAMSLVLQETLRSLAQLKEEVSTDSLTGLKNRRYFDDRLAQETSRAARNGGRFGVLAIDVNEFKMVNDVYGHLVGDDVLKAVASHLRSRLRAHDVVCRLGGDEFVVLMPDAGPAECAAAIRRLSAAVASNNPQHSRVTVSLALGAACWPRDGADAAELLHCADVNMYKDKQRADRQPQPRARVKSRRRQRVAAVR